MNEQKREQLQAEALDAYLTGLQSGREAPPSDAARPGSVPADQAALLNALVDLAEANAPDAGFAGLLEAQLHDAGARALVRQEVAARRPRPGNAAAAIAAAVERMSNVNRRLALSLAGAAVLVQSSGRREDSEGLKRALGGRRRYTTFRHGWIRLDLDDRAVGVRTMRGD